MTQMSITDTNSIVLVITEKVVGMATSHNVLIVNGSKAIDMKLHAMTRPSSETYKLLIGKI